MKSAGNGKKGNYYYQKLVKLQKTILSFMYDDFESGAWHDKNNTIHNLEKKTNNFDTSDKKH